MRTWDLWLCLIVYTITMIWFGMWMQTRADQLQLKKWTETAWSAGCNRCAQFEKDACERDQLQGVPVHSQIKEKS